MAKTLQPHPEKPGGYHHGDLRRAILDAAEAELTETGLQGFSLRRVAARVGVSHTAPSHHFGDAAGMIEALGERGFRSLLTCMQARQAVAGADPYEQLLASGMGYLDFALGHPALFRLVFGLPKRVDCSAGLQQAAEAAFMNLADAVAALPAHAPKHDMRAQVLAAWTRVHGLADLILSGHVTLTQDQSNQTAARTERDALFRSLFEVTFPRV